MMAVEGGGLPSYTTRQQHNFPPLSSGGSEAASDNAGQQHVGPLAFNAIVAYRTRVKEWMNPMEVEREDTMLRYKKLGQI